MIVGQEVGEDVFYLSVVPAAGPLVDVPVDPCQRPIVIGPLAGAEFFSQLREIQKPLEEFAFKPWKDGAAQKVVAADLPL